MFSITITEILSNALLSDLDKHVHATLVIIWVYILNRRQLFIPGSFILQCLAKISNSCRELDHE